MITHTTSVPSGLAARLLAEIEDLRPGLRCAITLELRNESPGPLVVTHQPNIVSVLEDAAGMRLVPAALTASGLVKSEQWEVIPSGARLAFRVDLQTVGAPAREQKRVLIAPGDKGWIVPAGKYLLATTVVFVRKIGGPPDQWTGTLDLPPISIEVPPALFTAN